MIEIKRCPFCGGPAKLEVSDVRSASFYFVVCTRCKSRGSGSTSEVLALSKWNQRVN